MRIRAALVLVSLLAVVPPPAGASHNCGTQLIIFSWPSGLNSAAAVCLAAGEDIDLVGYDPRIINPGSTGISLRYTQDLGEAVPTIEAVVDGLGFAQQTVTLTREQSIAGSWFYDSDVLPIPDGRTAAGCVTASIASVGVATAFHTVGSACPTS